MAVCGCRKFSLLAASFYFIIPIRRSAERDVAVARKRSFAVYAIQDDESDTAS
jgi:hypothetical protein